MRQRPASVVEALQARSLPAVGLAFQPGLAFSRQHGAGPELEAWPPAWATVIAGLTRGPESVDRLRQHAALHDGLAASTAFAIGGVNGGLTALPCCRGPRIRGADPVEIARVLLPTAARG